MQTDEIAALRELLIQRFNQSDELHSLRSEEVTRRLDDLTVQVRETNGRVRQHEATLNGHAPRLAAVERDVSDVKSEVKAGRRTLFSDLKTIVLVAIALVTSTVAVLGFFGKLQ
ncbi:MAG: hypothetical protein NUW22_12555 [Acidobacteria bacterium]|nr:hypothetical protein [Acidobacteriota bacterium]